jgi:hypothetical protein
MKTSNLPNRLSRAAFTWEVKQGVLQIIDLDNDETAPSVTNDAVNVLCDIYAADPDAFAGPVMYRDSRGVWDELKIANLGEKTLVLGGFSTLNETDEDRARALLKTRHHSAKL